MSKEIKKRGGLFKTGNYHSNGGIPFVIPETGQHVEIEKDEALIPNEAIKDGKVKKRTGKNIDVLHQINKDTGAKGMNEDVSEVHAGDVVICRKSMYDTKKRTYVGTDKQIVSAVNESNGCKSIAKGAKAVESNGKVVQFNKGGKISKEEQDAIRKERWIKKRERIETLSNNIQRLRLNVTRDLSSDNEKVFLTALAVAIMDKTGERVGNEVSAKNNHIGVTGFRKKHVTISGNKITLEYVGKSGVDHETSFSDEKLAKLLKVAIDNGKGYGVFTTSTGFRVKADRINRYLSDFGVTAKDIRGYKANRLIIDKLKDIEPEETDVRRKRQFNKIIKFVAQKIGHGRVTLKNHYMIPELETEYVEKSKIIDMKDLGYFKEGGEVLDVKPKQPTKKLIKPVKKDKTEAEVLAEIQKDIDIKDKEMKNRLTIEEIESHINRKLHWWKDDVVHISGFGYQKEYLKNSYRKL